MPAAMELRSILGSMVLAAFWGLALAEDKAAAGAAEAPKAEAPKTPAKQKDKKEPVLDIKRTGPPECQVKPVMTDAEIETCRRAGREPKG